MTRTGIRPGSVRLSGIMSDPVSVMTRNWTDCVLWSILYRSIYYTLISIHFSSRTPLSFHFRDFEPLKLANFDLNFRGEGEALVKIWPIYASKFNLWAFRKSKQILICSTHSRDIDVQKSVLFQKWSKFTLNFAYFSLI